jgi:hypothetical protein
MSVEYRHFTIPRPRCPLNFIPSLSIGDLLHSVLFLRLQFAQFSSLDQSSFPMPCFLRYCTQGHGGGLSEREEDRSTKMIIGPCHWTAVLLFQLVCPKSLRCPDFWPDLPLARVSDWVALISQVAGGTESAGDSIFCGRPSRRRNRWLTLYFSSPGHN